jgi:ATP-dependent RNA helicase SUPV3L1/SUV3
MTSVTIPYEVAVIDEIQMIRDTQRGWAWTRALLGVCAQEVHICGEASAIELVRHLAMVTGDVLEVRKYKRLTSLTVLNRAVESFDNVCAGDCIVCFSKNDIYTIGRQLEKRGVQFAVIYGTLPPGTKLAQAQKFNSPDNACKVMVATDAIGMGINLNIKRVIFYSLVKPYINEKGEKEMDVIPPSTALQIAGRAGRFASQFVEGEVTTFKSNDLALLKKLLNTPVEPIQQAGLHPTAEQIELFAYHLPKATLSNLIDIFVTLSQLDNDKYFMCNIDDFKFLADMIEHVPLQLRARYVFCCAPIPKKQPFVCAMFLKFARQFSRGQPLTLEWLCRQLGWPLQSPQSIVDLVHLEAVFDVLDLYLWLSYRFMDMFPDVEHIRDMQRELDQIIQSGVVNITRLLRNAETSVSSGVTADDEDDFEIQRRAPKPAKGSGVDSEYGLIDDDVGSKRGQASSKASLSARFQNANRVKAAAGDMGAGGGGSTASEKTMVMLQQLKPGQRLTDQLVRQGLLTKDMLKRIQQELTGDISSDDDETKNGGSSSRKRK